jgi:hypothetical protein
MRFARCFLDARAAEAELDLNKGLKRRHPCSPIAAHFVWEEVVAAWWFGGAALRVLDSMMPLASRALPAVHPSLNSPLLSLAISGLWWRPSCSLRAARKPGGSLVARTLSYNRIWSPTLIGGKYSTHRLIRAFLHVPHPFRRLLLHGLSSHACRGRFIFLLQAATLLQPRRESIFFIDDSPLRCSRTVVAAAIQARHRQGAGDFGLERGTDSCVRRRGTVVCIVRSDWRQIQHTTIITHAVVEHHGVRSVQVARTVICWP